MLDYTIEYMNVSQSKYICKSNIGNIILNCYIFFVT